MIAIENTTSFLEVFCQLIKLSLFYGIWDQLKSGYPAFSRNKIHHEKIINILLYLVQVFQFGEGSNINYCEDNNFVTAEELPFSSQVIKFSKYVYI